MPEWNIIQAPELIQVLRRSLGLRQAHVTPTLADEIVPVVLVKDLSTEIAAREKWANGYATGTGTTTPGHAPHVALFNPPGSGIRLRVRRVVAFHESDAPPVARVYAIQYLRGLSAQPVLNPVAGIAYWQDLDETPTPGTAAELWGGSKAASAYYWIERATDVFVFDPERLFVHPGQAVLVTSQVLGDGETMNGCFEWIEEQDVELAK